MKYIVNCSGGLTSFEALRRTLEVHGKANTHAYFADTQQEDEDLHRFLQEQERYFGIEIERVVDGRTIWEVWKQRRCITLRLPSGSEALRPVGGKRRGISPVPRQRYCDSERSARRPVQAHDLTRFSLAFRG